MDFPKSTPSLTSLLRRRWEIPAIAILLVVIGLAGKSFLSMPLILPIMLRKRRLQNVRQS